MTEEMKKDYGVSPETLSKKVIITTDEDIDNFIFTVIRPFCEMKSRYILSKNDLVEALKMYRSKQKTGKWVKDKNLYKCTSCNGLCTVAGWASCIPEEQMYKSFKYCPNCGVKMEGEEGE